MFFTCSLFNTNHQEKSYDCSKSGEKFHSEDWIDNHVEIVYEPNEGVSLNKDADSSDKR